MNNHSTNQDAGGETHHQPLFMDDFFVTGIPPSGRLYALASVTADSGIALRLWGYTMGGMQKVH